MQRTGTGIQPGVQLTKDGILIWSLWRMALVTLWSWRQMGLELYQRSRLNMVLQFVKWQNTTQSWSGEPELTEGTWLQLMCCAPSRLHCPKFWGNRVHRVYEDIPEYTGGDREDGVD